MSKGPKILRAFLCVRSAWALSDKPLYTELHVLRYERTVNTKIGNKYL